MIQPLIHQSNANNNIYTITTMEQSIYQRVMNVSNEIGTLSKDAKNPFYKSQYLTLNQLLDSLMPLLDKHQLTLTNYVSNGCLVTVIKTADETITSEFPIGQTLFSDPQKVGSVMTYARRYNLVSIFNIKAEDDDANNASGTNNTQQNAQETHNNDLRPDGKEKGWLNDKEIKKIQEKIDNGESVVMSILTSYYKISKANREVLINMGVK